MDINLRGIYKVRDDLYYNIIEFDQQYLRFKCKTLTIKELEQEVMEYSESSCDFKINDGIVLYNPLLKPVEVEQRFIQNLIKTQAEVDNMPELGSLYSLLMEGVEKGFCVVDRWDSEDKKAIISKFSNIHFSRNTMSVYVKMHSDEGVYNKMLVTFEDGILKFHPFTVATTGVVSGIPGCEDLKTTIKINNVEYNLWQTNSLSLYESSSIFSEGVVNQACCDSVVYASAIMIVSDFIDDHVVYSADSKASEWVGGNKDYRSNLGVYFSPSCRIPTRQLRASIMLFLQDEFDKGKTYDEAYSAVCEWLTGTGYFNRCTNYAAKVLGLVLGAEGTLKDKLQVAFVIKDKLQNKQFWADMYCYRIRTVAYLQKANLVSHTRPCLVGGNTKDYTNVRAGYEI